MISFVDCEDVRVEGITFEQPGCSRAVHLRGCRKVIVARITSVNGSRDNSDAVRIEGCEDVLIEDSRLQAGATCIGVLAEHKGGDEPPRASTNITVRGSVFEASQCGVTLRSSGGLVSEIDISRCRMDRVGTGLWIDGVKGVIEHVTVHDIEMGQVDGDAIRFTYTGAAGPRSDAGVQALRKVHVRRLTCTHAGTAVYLSGVFTAPEPEIVLQDLNITSDRGLICNESAGLRLANVRITPLSGPVLAVKDSRNIVIEGLTPPARRGVFLDLRGRQVRDVRLHGTPGSRIRPVVVLGIDVPRDAIVHNELP